VTVEPLPHTISRVLVTSLGSIGRRHLANLRALKPAFELGVLRLTGGDVSNEIAALYDRELKTLADALAFAPHCAIVASPASAHVELATALLSNGIPVFLEKPISHTMDGVEALARLARIRQLPLMIGYNLRFLPSLMKTAALLDSGAVGRVISVQAEIGQYLPDWRPKSDYRSTVSAQSGLGGGALLELSHEIDYVYWIMGMPKSVYCIGGRLSDLDTDVEDCVEILLQYEYPSRIARIHLDFLQRPATRSCKIVGSSGTIVWDGMADSVQLSAHGGSAAPDLFDFKGDRNQMYVDEVDHFLRCVAHGTPPSIDAEQGYDVLAIVEAARRSMIDGVPVTPMGFRQ
jgi:predicted dehydrogenase